MVAIKNMLTDYHVSGTVGEGAFSKVKLATHKKTQEKVAVKVISKDRLAKNFAAKEKERIQRARRMIFKKNDKYFNNNIDFGETFDLLTPETEHQRVVDNQRRKEKEEELLTQMPGGFSNRLAKEVRLLQNLEHPNIIKLYEVIETPEEYYIIMQYAGGGEIIDYISKNGRLSEPEARKYFREIISAIGHCHDSGILHRDLKLENILLSTDKRILISDFGLGRQFKTDERCSTFCGTPLYASPELVSGIQYFGPPTDIWAMGVVLYAMISGKPPFQADTMAELYKKIKHTIYDPPPNCSNGLKNLFSRIFTSNPEKRIVMDDLRNDPWVCEGYGGGPMRSLPVWGLNEGANDKCRSIGFGNKTLKFSFNGIPETAQESQPDNYTFMQKIKRRSKSAFLSTEHSSENLGTQRRNSGFEVRELMKGNSTRNSAYLNKNKRRSSEKVQSQSNLTGPTSSPALLSQSSQVSYDLLLAASEAGTQPKEKRRSSVSDLMAQRNAQLEKQKQDGNIINSLPEEEEDNGSGHRKEVFYHKQNSYGTSEDESDISKVMPALSKQQEFARSKQSANSSSLDNVLHSSKQNNTSDHESREIKKTQTLSSFVENGDTSANSSSTNSDQSGLNEKINKNNINNDNGTPKDHVRTVKDILHLSLMSSKNEPIDLKTEIFRVLTMLNITYSQSSDSRFVVKHSSAEDSVDFELEVVKVWLVSMCGVRIRKLRGSERLYKLLCKSIINAMQLEV